MSTNESHIYLFYSFIYFRHQRKDDLEPKPTDIEFQPSSQRLNVNLEKDDGPYLDLDASTRQPQTEYQTISNYEFINSDNGTYPEGVISNSPLDENHEYQYIRDQNTVLKDEKPYMVLDASSRQPNSVYQKVTNPKSLKQSDTYLALDPESRSKETEYQSIDPRKQDA